MDPTVNYFTTHPLPIDSGNIVPMQSPLTICAMATYMETPFSLPSTINCSRQKPAPTAIIKPESRRIITQQLPQTTSSVDLMNLLVKKVPKEEFKPSRSSNWGIQQLDIAVPSDGKSMRHAFVVFDTHQMAIHVVTTLNGLWFQGGVLNARFAEEGAGVSKEQPVKISGT
jgi:RNA recognition motif-containing protein